MSRFYWVIVACFLMVGCSQSSDLTELVSPVPVMTETAVETKVLPTATWAPVPVETADLTIPEWTILLYGFSDIVPPDLVAGSVFVAGEKMVRHYSGGGMEEIQIDGTLSLDQFVRMSKEGAVANRYLLLVPNSEMVVGLEDAVDLIVVTEPAVRYWSDLALVGEKANYALFVQTDWDWFRLWDQIGVWRVDSAEIGAQLSRDGRGVLYSGGDILVDLRYWIRLEELWPEWEELVMSEPEMLGYWPDLMKNEMGEIELTAFWERLGAVTKNQEQKIFLTELSRLWNDMLLGDRSLFVREEEEGWEKIWEAYHEASNQTVLASKLSVVQISKTELSSNDPIFMNIELMGEGIKEVAFVAGTTDDNSQLRLYQYDLLLPDGGYWLDGLAKELYIWDGVGHYLFGAGDGLFVLPFAVGDQFLKLNGRWVSGAGVEREAELLFSAQTGEMIELWGINSDGYRSFLEPEAGDRWFPYEYYLINDQLTRKLSAQNVTFLDGGQLGLANIPFSDGTYVAGFRLQSVDQSDLTAFVDLKVNGEDDLTGYRRYIALREEISFLYPLDWDEPVRIADGWVGYDDTHETSLRIMVYPEKWDGSTVDLRHKGLQILGDVEILAEHRFMLPIEGESIIVEAVVYGYEGENGGRTGQLIAFVREGKGYLIDVDGGQAEEKESLHILDRLVRSWRFESVKIEPGSWKEVGVGGIETAVPVQFSHRQLESKWELFSGIDGITFIALRADPLSEGETSDMIREWLIAAGDNVAGFETSVGPSIWVRGRRWEQASFHYTNGDGDLVQGMIIGSKEAERELVAWVEAPAESYTDLVENIFLVVVADIK